MRKLNRNQILIIAAGAIILLIGAASFVVQHNAQTPLPPPATPPEQAGAIDHMMGKTEAKVLVVEYGSPTCSVCAQWDKDVFPQLKQKYIDTGKVIFVYRIMPRNELDGEVAKLAACLPENKFFEFIDMMYRNQPVWDAEEYPVQGDVNAALVQMGQKAGLSADKVTSCRQPNKPLEDAINAVAAAGAAKYNIDSTPTFVVNGYRVPSGFLYWDSLDSMVDAALTAK